MKQTLITALTLLLLLAGCAGDNQESSESPETAGLAGTRPDTHEAVKPTAVLVMEVNGKTYYPELADNSSAEAFFDKLREGPLKLELHDYGNFEKVGSLPWELPENDEEITTVPGDIILYQGKQLSVYYDENTCSLTGLAKIKQVEKEELLAVLGDGDVTVEFWLEWGE